jgi:hypothetical protein
MNIFTLSNTARLKWYGTVTLVVAMDSSQHSTGFSSAVPRRYFRVRVSDLVLRDIYASNERQAQAHAQGIDVDIDIPAIMLQHNALPGLMKFHGIWGMPMTNMYAQHIEQWTEDEYERMGRFYDEQEDPFPYLPEDMPENHVWFRGYMYTNVRSTTLLFVETLLPNRLELGFVVDRERLSRCPYGNLHRALNPDGTLRNIFAINQRDTAWLLDDMYSMPLNRVNPYNFVVWSDSPRSTLSDSDEGSVSSISPEHETVYMVSIGIMDADNHVGHTDMLNRITEEPLNIVWK